MAVESVQADFPLCEIESNNYLEVYPNLKNRIHVEKDLWFVRQLQSKHGGNSRFSAMQM